MENPFASENHANEKGQVARDLAFRQNHPQKKSSDA